MALKYYKSSHPTRVFNPTKSYHDDFLEISNLSFENAPNVIYNEIQYEAHYGHRDFIPIDMVRVDPVVNYNTGIQIGDDFKVFVFKPDFPVKPYYGMKFKWGKNYYLVINTNNNGSMSVSAEVRRCNNTLRFFDENGNKIYEPCILDQVLRFTNNNDTMTIVTGKAEQYVWCQRNKRTVKIKPNDRFLFGVPEQRIGFRLYAGGLGNSLNTVTGDDYSPTLTQFYIEEYEINYQLDDLVSGFANTERYEYSIDISENNLFYNIGAVSELNSVVYRGKNIVEEDVIWETSDYTIVSIDGNKLTALSPGTVEIFAFMKDNKRIYGSLNITVLDDGSLDDKYEILISPDIDYVLEGETITLNVDLYKNGIKQDNSIEIKDISINVPRKNYKLIASNNSFTLSNYKMYLENPVVVECSCDDVVRVFEFTLRGLY